MNAMKYFVFAAILMACTLAIAFAEAPKAHSQANPAQREKRMPIAGLYPYSAAYGLGYSAYGAYPYAAYGAAIAPAAYSYSAYRYPAYGAYLY